MTYVRHLIYLLSSRWRRQIRLDFCTDSFILSPTFLGMHYAINVEYDWCVYYVASHDLIIYACGKGYAELGVHYFRAGKCINTRYLPISTRLRHSNLDKEEKTDISNVKQRKNRETEKKNSLAKWAIGAFNSRVDKVFTRRQRRIETNFKPNDWQQYTFGNYPSAICHILTYRFL